jgi:hypothetical protein
MYKKTHGEEKHLGCGGGKSVEKGRRRLLVKVGEKQELRSCVHLTLSE